VDRPEAEEVVEALSRFANTMNLDGNAFVAALMREHRTLQQSIFGLMLASIEAWAELPENRYDARNAFTVGRCREIVDFMGKFNMRPPCI